MSSLLGFRVLFQCFLMSFFTFFGVVCVFFLPWHCFCGWLSGVVLIACFIDRKKCEERIVPSSVLFWIRFFILLILFLFVFLFSFRFLLLSSFLIFVIAVDFVSGSAHILVRVGRVVNFVMKLPS